jgi:murein DD-endopeptidase MepM/ murein hydrolase activator NlpD
MSTRFQRIARVLVVQALFLGLTSSRTNETASALCRQWNLLYEQMQYGTVDRREAGKLLRQITRLLTEQLTIPQDSNFYFPVEGYGLPDVGGKNGDGFIPRQYNFLHGNAHRGHPAHDIFIHDADEDGLDDFTAKRVHVLAMTDGVVVAAKNNWSAGDTLRGGNYLMIYNPNLSRYYYYAHNHEILVQVGDVVRAGQRVATVGRTGRNASESRSPTHLHLMVLQITDDRGRPYNYYPELEKAIRTKAAG